MEDFINPNILKAGAATADITPKQPQFLFGYPFVERMSTGTHDPLLSSALYLTDGQKQVMFISNDIIYISKKSTKRIRKSISEKTGVPASHILIAATHTHSGPMTVECATSENDPVIPKIDEKYVEYMESRITEAACEAFKCAEQAEIAFTIGDATGVGTNRHDPFGPKDMDLPVMIVRNVNGQYIACMLACNMHPTVLHEDSTLYSSDFPFFVRDTLQTDLLGKGCPVIYFTGTAGNQSPRHVTKANSFDEARRIGVIVADSVKLQLSGNAMFITDCPISVLQSFIDLPKREFPPVDKVERHRDKVKSHYEKLKTCAVSPQEIRTAEVDWFGAEELLFLSDKAKALALDAAYDSCLPAEVQIIKIGNQKFIAWPGEIFVEYGLELKKQCKNISLITYANGELQGYLTTKEACEKGFYEACNSFFDYKSGEILMNETIRLLRKLDQNDERKNKCRGD